MIDRSTAIVSLLTGMLVFVVLNMSYGQLGGNYWNLNYGTKAQLLNGAVIGGVEDNSAIFYNPAAIGTDTVGGGLSLSLFSPSYSIINTNSNQLNDLRITDFDLLPNMAVLDFPFLKNTKLKSSLGLFSRRSFDLNFASQFDIAYTPSQDFTGTTNYRNKIDEDWIGFGLSYEITDKFQIGITQGLTIRSQTQSTFINGRATNYSPSLNNQLQYNSFNEFKTRHPSINTKLGMLWHRKNYSIGLTVTTPSYISILDGGSYQLIEPQFLDGVFVDVFEETKDDLSSDFKKPWSFGIGGFYTFYKQDKLYFSVERFNKIAPYPLLSNPDSEIKFRLLDASTVVTNVALGYENKMSETFTLLCGLRTDFNSNVRYELPEAGDRDLFNFSWNIFHITAGGLFSIGSFKFSAGLGYAYSRSDEEVFNPFQTVFESFQISDFELATSTSTYNSLTVFFNYSLLFERFTSKP